MLPTPYAPPPLPPNPIQQNQLGERASQSKSKFQSENGSSLELAAGDAREAGDDSPRGCRDWIGGLKNDVWVVERELLQGVRVEVDVRSHQTHLQNHRKLAQHLRGHVFCSLLKKIASQTEQTGRNAFFHLEGFAEDPAVWRTGKDIDESLEDVLGELREFSFGKLGGIVGPRGLHLRAHDAVGQVRVVPHGLQICVAVLDEALES